MIAIIKYNAGNITSVKNALNRLGYNSKITNDHQELLTAEKVILPGVGEASSAMKYLYQHELDKVIMKIEQPFLGICLGLQLMCDFSEEGKTKGLGIFNTTVKKFPPKDKVPHMGWNSLTNIRGDLFSGVHKNDDVYFVHSYYAEINEQTTASCEYITPFGAAMQEKNYYATQFHPEKSAQVGEKILKNFLAL